VGRLEIVGCTLAPGGYSLRDGAAPPCSRAATGGRDTDSPIRNDVNAFVPTPDIVIQRSIVGSVAVDERYRLDIEDSIVDAGLGVHA
jgi:hypothetical protein